MARGSKRSLAKEGLKQAPPGEQSEEELRALARVCSHAYHIVLLYWPRILVKHAAIKKPLRRCISRMQSERYARFTRIVTL